MNKEGYLYYITSDLLDCVKVGFWRSKLKILCSRYITTYGNIFELVCVKNDNCVEMEKEFSIFFSKYKIRNELYNKLYIDKYREYFEEVASRINTDLVFINNKKDAILLDNDANNTHKNNNTVINSGCIEKDIYNKTHDNTKTKNLRYTIGHICANCNACFGHKSSLSKHQKNCFQQINKFSDTNVDSDVKLIEELKKKINDEKAKCEKLIQEKINFLEDDIIHLRELLYIKTIMNN